MAKVRIVTDATAHLSPEVIDPYEITVLPVEIRFGEETFTINPGADTQWLFERMEAEPARITTATIPIPILEKAFARLSREAEDVLVILSSSQLSRAYDNAQVAARAFLGRCRITVLDSMSTSWGLGLIVEAAAKAAAEGQLPDDIIRLVRGMLPHLYLVLVIERLDYLERGDRLDVAQALLGTMLQIKPILLLESGEIVSLEKVRTRNMALEKLVEFVEEFATIQQVVILRSPLEDSMEELIEALRRMLADVLPDRAFQTVEYGPLLACHLGPEALGVFVYEGL